MNVKELTLNDFLDMVQNKLSLLNDEIETREFKFEEHSEKWQRSIKGVEYEDKTKELQCKYDEIKQDIEDLEDIVLKINDLL